MKPTDTTRRVTIIAVRPSDRDSYEFEFVAPDTATEAEIIALAKEQTDKGYTPVEIELSVIIWESPTFEPAMGGVVRKKPTNQE